MDSKFSRCLSILFGHEGGWSDRPLKDDPGGPTNYGVTIKTFAAYKKRPVTKDELRNISRVEVEDIYRKQYWNPVKGDDLPAGLDLAMFDFAVNSGPATAVEHLQRRLGVPADGMLGLLTMDAVRGRNPVDLINHLCADRLAYMQTLKNWNANKNGWRRRVTEVRGKALMMAAGKKPAPVPVPPTPKANPADVKPTAKPNAKEKIAAGAGTAGGVIADAVEKLTPYQELAVTLKWVCLALVVAGIGVMLWRLFQKGE